MTPATVDLLFCENCLHFCFTVACVDLRVTICVRLTRFCILLERNYGRRDDVENVYAFPFYLSILTRFLCTNAEPFHMRLQRPTACTFMRCDSQLRKCVNLKSDMSIPPIDFSSETKPRTDSIFIKQYTVYIYCQFNHYAYLVYPGKIPNDRKY